MAFTKGKIAVTKAERYTEEDILLLMDRMDAKFSTHIFNFRKSFDKMRPKHTLKQAIKKILLFYYRNDSSKTQMDAIFKSSLENMPLLINDPLKSVAVIARWRLEINK